MIKTHKTKVPANISAMSLVGILSEDYPLSYGNYFTMRVETEYQIPNLNESMSKEGTEYGLTAALDKVKEKHGMVAYVPEGESFDIGLPDSYFYTFSNFSKEG